MSTQSCLVLGMSHVEAIKRGIPDNENIFANIVNLNDSPAIYDQINKSINLEGLDKSRINSIFLSLGGNFYNIFGLLENPSPFVVHGKAVVDDARERVLIPRAMLKDQFKVRLDGLTNLMKVLCDHFSESSVFHICSPPPVETAAHINKFPGIFGKRLNMGIAPSELRKNLYDLQTEIYQEQCSTLGIEFIPPPPSSLNSNGFLGEQYLNTDPTHGNEKYGALVWSQIKDRVDG